MKDHFSRQSGETKSLTQTTDNLPLFTADSARFSRLTLFSNVLISNITLEQCFDEYIKTELLENGNEWYCSNCKNHVKAKKQVTLWKGKLPKILIISLKRFEFRGQGNSTFNQSNLFGGQREKIEDFVDFPLEGLDLSSFCHKNSLMEENDSMIYDLFAVCNHYGRMGYGHYTAFARDFIGNDLSSQWYSFDDDVVKGINPGAVKSRAAYILFYRQRE